jgi:hypothetical protein
MYKFNHRLMWLEKIGFHIANYRQRGHVAGSTQLLHRYKCPQLILAFSDFTFKQTTKIPKDSILCLSFSKIAKRVFV